MPEKTTEQGIEIRSTDEISVSPNGLICNQIQNSKKMEIGSVAKEVLTKSRCNTQNLLKTIKEIYRPVPVTGCSPV
jgi:hypothetical protein